MPAQDQPNQKRVEELRKQIEQRKQAGQDVTNLEQELKRLQEQPKDQGGQQKR